ncbi:hypothetical protein D3C87_1458010 [compost metagenome]
MVAGECLAAQRQCSRSALERLRIGTRNHQQFAERVIGVGNHGQARTIGRWHLQTGYLRTIGTADENDRVTFLRNLAQVGRKARTAIAR